MNLSTPQVQRFWREWSAACRYQGWTGNLSAPEIDAKRKELLARAGFTSLTKVDKTAGFDRVLAELRALQDDVKRTIETIDHSIGDARRLRVVIMLELVPCLALYPLSNPMQQFGAERFVIEIMADKNRWWKIDRPATEITLMDLNEEQLQQLLSTVNARLHSKRREAGHSIHDMKLAAGLQCDCATICRAARMAFRPVEPPVAVPAATETVTQPF